MPGNLWKQETDKDGKFIVPYYIDPYSNFGMK